MDDDSSNDSGQAANDGRDNKRAFRWGTIVAAVVAVVALGYNMVSNERASPLGRDAASTTQSHKVPAPAAPAGTEAPAPGTAGGQTGGGAAGSGQPGK
ncbi:MAG: hypothetical protein JSS56_23860 [Proteobacteria bacterium]|nr:hypothetical protein [Pseudomonadota bacterium]